MSSQLIRTRKEDAIKEFERIWSNKNWIRFTRKEEELPASKIEDFRKQMTKPRRTIVNSLKRHERILEIDTEGLDNSFYGDRSNRPLTGRADVSSSFAAGTSAGGYESFGGIRPVILAGE